MQQHIRDYNNAIGLPQQTRFFAQHGMRWAIGNVLGDPAAVVFDKKHGSWNYTGQVNRGYCAGPDTFVVAWTYVTVPLSRQWPHPKVITAWPHAPGYIDEFDPRCG